jgi:predicted nucleic acid-binding protein
MWRCSQTPTLVRSLDCIWTPQCTRVAERLLLATGSLPLRTLDALHLALAFWGAATHVLTFDRRMREAAVNSGLNVIDL